MKKLEQLSSHENCLAYRRYLKRQGRRWLRRLGRISLDDAPRKLRFRGYST